MMVVVSVCASPAGGAVLVPLARCLAFALTLPNHDTINAFGGFRGPGGTKYKQITGQDINRFIRVLAQ